MNGIVYIIHQTTTGRSTNEEFLYQYGVFGSYVSAINAIRSIAEIKKEELEKEHNCNYVINEEIIDSEDPYTFDLFTIHPVYDEDDECEEDYREVVELFAYKIGFTK